MTLATTMLRSIKILLFVVAGATACASSPQPKSDHFDGEKKEWPEFRENKIKPGLLTVVDSTTLGVTFINHASFLIQANGLNVLTDPIFSERASPFQWAGPKRVRRPGLEMKDLPRIDLVVISHNHYDHMDHHSIKELQEKFAPLFIAPLGDAKILNEFGAKNVIELDWWQSHQIRNSDLVVTFTPVQHWSSRTPFDISLIPIGA